MEWELTAGTQLQAWNPEAAQDVRTLEKGKIFIGRLLCWNNYSLSEGPAIVLEPL